MSFEMHNDQVLNSSSYQQPSKCCWRSHCFLRWDSGKRTCTLENLSLGTFVVTIGSIRLLLPNVTSGMYRAQTTCAQPEWTVIVNQSHQPYTVTYCIVGNFRGRKLSQISRFCNYLRNFSPRIGGCGTIHYKQYQVAMPFGFNFMGSIYCYPGKSLCSCSNETITAVRNFPIRWCQKISLK